VKDLRSEAGQGFTLIELAMAIAILGILAGIALPSYSRSIEKARVTKAIAEVSELHKEIELYKTIRKALPDTFNEIHRGSLVDPWGNPYQYLNFTKNTETENFRKDRFGVPLNKHYDVYSMGRDGESEPSITEQTSHDDVIRANDGLFIGLASEFQ
jgi:general secretion pathway protein G